MAKYDWKQLEKEYILGNYKSINSFLKEKGISRNKTTNTQTKEWNIKKHQKDIKKTSKTVEKTIEKESEKEAQQIVDIKSIANDLALNVLKANKEINIYMDIGGNKHKGLIDKKGLKQLTSALKDLNEILNKSDTETKEDKIDKYLSALEGAIKND